MARPAPWTVATIAAMPKTSRTSSGVNTFGGSPSQATWVLSDKPSKSRIAPTRHGSGDAKLTPCVECGGSSFLNFGLDDSVVRG